MRDISAALSELLLSKRPFWSADLFTFTLSNGTTLHLTSADRSITYGTTTWQAASAVACAITRGQWGVKNTLDVPTLEIKLFSTGEDWNGGDNIKLALHNGLLDGCWIDLYRAFMPMTSDFGDTSLGIVNLFSGRAGQVEIVGTGAKITVKGANIKLQSYMPRNRFLTNCIHQLYGPGCGLAKASYTFTAAFSFGNSLTLSWASDPTSGAYAALVGGALQITGGAGAGQKRTISGASATAVTVSYPLYTVPAAGDAFTVSYGCDKLLATCKSRFSNGANFRGFPYTPPAETAAVA